MGHRRASASRQRLRPDHSSLRRMCGGYPNTYLGIVSASLVNFRPPLTDGRGNRRPTVELATVKKMGMLTTSGPA